MLCSLLMLWGCLTFGLDTSVVDLATRFKGLSAQAYVQAVACESSVELRRPDPLQIPWTVLLEDSLDDGCLHRVAETGEWLSPRFEFVTLSFDPVPLQKIALPVEGSGRMENSTASLVVFVGRATPAIAEAVSPLFRFSDCRWYLLKCQMVAAAQHWSQGLDKSMDRLSGMQAELMIARLNRMASGRRAFAPVDPYWAHYEKVDSWGIVLQDARAKSRSTGAIAVSPKNTWQLNTGWTWLSNGKALLERHVRAWVVKGAGFLRQGEEVLTGLWIRAINRGYGAAWIYVGEEEPVSVTSRDSGEVCVGPVCNRWNAAETSDFLPATKPIDPRDPNSARCEFWGR